MPKYIESEALSEYFREKFEYYKAESEIKVFGGYMYDEKMQYAAIVAKHFLDELKRTPAADVVEIVHGEWISEIGSYCTPRCSACDWSKPYTEDYYCAQELYQNWNYCPNCGAKMDRKGADNAEQN